MYYALQLYIHQFGDLGNLVGDFGDHVENSWYMCVLQNVHVVGNPPPFM